MTDFDKASALVPGAMRNFLRVPPSPPAAAQTSLTSQYAEARPQPPNQIADVDSGRNIYSPQQPIAPFGPPAITYPREWDYQPGANIDIVPARLGFFEMLRIMSQSWGILRTVIETRKDQIMRLPWAISSRANPRQTNARVAELTSFFKKPDGKNRWDRWFRLLLEDLLVIDAATLYTGWRRADGKPFVVEVLDGATIKPLIDDAGRRPDYPSPAYQQIIKGLPLVNFDESEILYAPMRPRPQMPMFGYATATLTATNQYSLTTLTRGLYGSTAAAHATGAPFARLDDAIFKYDLPDASIGQELYLKFQSFNTFGNAVEDISTCAVYSYTPVGSGVLGPVAQALAAGIGLDYGLAGESVSESDDFGLASDCYSTLIDMGTIST